MLRYFIVYKPFQVLSQFTSDGGKRSLANVFEVPKDVYAVGRLDYDSEGLLILTNDARINHLLLNPKHKHEREYWVQVEGEITQHALLHLQSGVHITIDGHDHKTLPCRASFFEEQPKVFERHPAIRYRKNIPTSWISISLVEGKNRQVRRMTASVGFPTLRLIRYRIEKVTIEGLEPGGMKELSKHELYKMLSI